MPHVVTRACIGVNDRACVAVYPVEAFHDGRDQLYIHPDVCIDCGLCVPECPMSAIFGDEDVPEEMRGDIAKNALAFTGRHQAGCGCGSCDPQTHQATGSLPETTPN